MNNNWRANRAWHKIEDKKVIINSHRSPVPTTTSHQLLQILGWGGVGSGHSAPMYLYGVFGKSAKKILLEIIKLLHFLVNTNARQTGEKKIHKTLVLSLAVRENSTPPQL